MVEKIPMTEKGYDALREELQKLRSVERPAVIKAIAEAREHGDLSENAEYDAARNRQSFLEGRIAELEDKISRAEVIDPASLRGNTTVMFGAVVSLVDCETEQEQKWQLVGAHESSIEEGLISIASPLARAMIGKSVGDVIEVSTPGGRRDYEILEISFG